MPEENNLVAMTIEVVASYVAHNNLRPEDMPDLIAKTHAAISGIAKAEDPAAVEPPPAEETFSPAVTARKSLASPDHILSMIDGKPYKSLKRHLGSHGLTPAEYRTRYGLKADYPMVAPSYSAQRRDVAKRLGLGRKPRTPDAAGEPSPPSSEPAASAPAKPKRGRRAAPATPTANSTPAKAPRRRKAPTTEGTTGDA